MQRARTHRLTNLVALCLGATWPALAQEPQTSAPEQRVMIIRDGAELKAGANVVAPASLGQMLEVSQTQGDWLWIGSESGWLNRRDVVPADKAIQHFTAALEQNPTAEAHRRRAVAFAALGRYDEALQDLSEAIRRDPRNVVAYNDRGNVERKLGRLDDALAGFNQIVEQGVRHPAVYTNRGLVRADVGDYSSALEDYNAAVQLDPRFAPAWEAAGAARQVLGEYQRAIQNYERAVNSDSGFARAHNNLAWLLAAAPDDLLRDGMRAVEHATKAAELSGFKEPHSLDTLAAAYAESGRFEEWAERALQESTEAPRSEIEERLTLYRAGKPYRLEPGRTESAAPAVPSRLE